MANTDLALELMSRVFGAPAVPGAGTRFAVLAGETGLRWIIPADLGAASRVLSEWAPYKPSTRIGWRLATAASRAGALTAIPGVRSLRFDLSAVRWETFGWTGATPPHVVLYVGTPVERQKLVCTLIDRETLTGRMIVKFPLGATAREGMGQEFTVLRDIAATGLDIAPRAVMAGDGLGFTAQSYLRGAPGNVSLSRHHIEFLVQLIDPKQPLEMQALRAKLVARREAALDLSAPVRNAIDRVLSRGHWSGTIPSARVHGDFAPWNLKHCADGRLRAVDWEDSVQGGLPYVDLHHFRRSLERLRRSSSVPWQDYTAAIRGLAPGFTDEVAATVRDLAAIESWIAETDRWDGVFDCEGRV
ncbi:MAG: aminoglycoside phosphotransferase family protein [Alphaproteobacteria bacterium]|nr:aminoglycoside phosphotransferase family protein [Alphaproteobacteria bacterium]